MIAGPADPASHLRDGMRGLRWDVGELFVATAAIGGFLRRDDVAAIASGQRQPSPHEYDVMAAALNERFTELGRNHPLPCWADLPPG